MADWFFGFATINGVDECSEPRGDLGSKEEADACGAWPGLFTQGPFDTEEEARARMAVLCGRHAARDRYVVVRDNRAGVYAGTLDTSEVPGQTTLRNARHIWSWAGRLGTVDIAVRGVGEGSRVTGVCSRVDMYDVVAIIDCTAEAQTIIEGFPSWTA